MLTGYWGNASQVLVDEVSMSITSESDVRRESKIYPVTTRILKFPKKAEKLIKLNESVVK